jgi:hypothetical protein
MKDVAWYFSLGNSFPLFSPYNLDNEASDEGGSEDGDSEGLGLEEISEDVDEDLEGEGEDSSFISELGETEAGESGVQGQPELHSKFCTSMCYT